MAAAVRKGVSKGRPAIAGMRDPTATTSTAQATTAIAAEITKAMPVGAGAGAAFCMIVRAASPPRSPQWASVEGAGSQPSGAWAAGNAKDCVRVMATNWHAATSGAPKPALRSPIPTVATTRICRSATPVHGAEVKR